jgi:thioester reductase-like protein/2-polyprenyl-3-methyl-5-hydroxy-6-metoxy-1,4-benzoquinol methylase
MDLIYQPIAIPRRASTETSTAISSDQQELYATLDALAYQNAKKQDTFQDIIGSVSAPKLVSEEDEHIQTLREKWPAHFSVHNALSESQVDASLMTKLFEGYRESTTNALKHTIDRIVSDANKKVVRVLEIGAGSGAMSSNIAATLATVDSSVVVEYFMTDASVTRAMRCNHPYSRSRSLDINKSPETQGFVPNTFDIIVGFRALEASTDLKSTVQGLHSLLVPGGSLLLAEFNETAWTTRDAGTLWLDLAFAHSETSHIVVPNAALTQAITSAGFSDLANAANYSDSHLISIKEVQKSGESLVPRDSAPGKPVIVRYALSDEMSLHAEVMKLDAESPVSLWIVTGRKGWNEDGRLGFSRTLRREYPSWDVYLVIFDNDWTEEAQQAHVSQLYRTPGIEKEMIVDSEGKISVPRVVPSPSPPTHKPFNPQETWSVDGTEVSHVDRPAIKAHHALARVSAWAPNPEGPNGFVCTIEDVGTTSLKEGVQYVGLTYEKFRSTISVHEGQVAVLPGGVQAERAAAGALALAIIAFGLGGFNAKRMSGQRILVTHSDSHTGQIIVDICRKLGIDTEKLSSKMPSVAVITHASLRGYDKILTAFTGKQEKQTITQSLSNNGSSYVWSDVSPTISKNPWALGDALEAGLKATQNLLGSVPTPSVVDTAAFVKDKEGTMVPIRSSLCDPKKAYILVGGIGGLGVHVALYLYQQGARYIVLTSRSGKLRDNLLGDRIIEYLGQQPDLTIRMESCDARSIEATKKLVASIPVPIGGVMLLSAVLRDKTFAHQTAEDFEAVLLSKVEALQVVSEAIDIPSLDFFVPFSSGVALIGNGGQTPYAGANSTLDGITRYWKNTFSFVIPAIVDAGGLFGELAAANSHATRHLTQWGMTCAELVKCLGDGIRKLTSEPFWQYVPDFQWDLVSHYLGESSMYEHLVPTKEDDGSDGDDKGGERSMEDVVMAALDVDPQDFSPDVPFTAYGLDSLVAARLASALRPFVAVTQLQLLADITLADLQARIEEAGNAGEESDQATETKNDQVEHMESLVTKYSTGFPQHQPSVSTAPETETILLTGSTGSMGCFMLADLVALPSVSRIYALNRKDTHGHSLKERQVISLRDRGLDASLVDSPKVVLLEGDISKSNLGLDSAVYNEIRDSVTCVLHNAWSINLAAGLQSFNPLLDGVRHLIDLSLGSPLPSPPRFLFVSSIGVVHNWPVGETVDETIVADAKVALGTGYGESKWIAERVLENASKTTTLRPVVARVGQLSGGSNGYWTQTEWFPSLARSAKRIGCIPGVDQNISWLPIDTAASIVVQLRDSSSACIHVAHPKPVPWRSVVQPLSTALNVPIVAPADFLKRVETMLNSSNEDEVNQNPVLRLFDFFREGLDPAYSKRDAMALPILKTDNGKHDSSILADPELPPVGERDVQAWLGYWRGIGAISA